MMNPVSPLPIVAAIAVAIATAFLLGKIFPAPPQPVRIVSIDGLRGYLALLVFLHHSAIWYFYLQTGEWDFPPSRLYRHCGQSSVSLFFMITGFLFYSRLLSARDTGLDWGKLFVGRFLRIMPLYFVAIGVVFLIVAAQSGFSLSEPAPAVLGSASRWLFCSFLGMPDINGVEDTALILADVTWTLRYEWLFYLALPLLALTVGSIPPRRYLAIGFTAAVIAAAGLYSGLFRWRCGMPFAGGILAAYLVKSEMLCRLAVTRTASIVCIGCVAVAVACFQYAYAPQPLLLLTVSFVIIACGNTLFGTLAMQFSRTLGEMAYSIYLLHGIVLFTVFNFLIGVESARALSPAAYWGVILLIVPGLVCLCYFTFQTIEHPSMRSATPVTAWLRRWSTAAWSNFRWERSPTTVPLPEALCEENAFPVAVSLESGSISK